MDVIDKYEVLIIVESSAGRSHNLSVNRDKILCFNFFFFFCNRVMNPNIVLVCGYNRSLFIST